MVLKCGFLEQPSHCKNIIFYIQILFLLLRCLEEQLQLWNVEVQSELYSQEDTCDKLEAKIEVLLEHNKNL
ncbi:UNVERIFIED_CONTAM: hypothetical protein FKN15_077429 [Acipenser sinensis]